MFFLLNIRPIYILLEVEVQILFEMVLEELASLLVIKKLDFGGKLFRLFGKLARVLSNGTCDCATEVALEL